MMLDAKQNFFKELTKECLFDWQAALFTTGVVACNALPLAAWRPIETEQAVMQAIEGLSKDFTLLIVALRLTTLKN